MNRVAESDGEAALRREVARWHDAGTKPQFFLRDDDAIADTPALRKLFALCERFDVPLLLAAIPRDAEAALGELVRTAPLVTGAVHGWAHVDHTPPGQKICELGTDRPIEIVLGELAEGRKKLLDLFDGDLSGLLVPPWNRIHDPVLEAIGQAGFAGVSRHGWPEHDPPAGLVELNTHVDIIHWSGGQVGRSHGWVFAELARNLEAARNHDWSPVGLLTHHRDHDEQAWTVLKAALSKLNGDCAEWIAPDALLTLTK